MRLIEDPATPLLRLLVRIRDANPDKPCLRLGEPAAAGNSHFSIPRRRRMQAADFTAHSEPGVDEFIQRLSDIWRAECPELLELIPELQALCERLAERRIEETGDVSSYKYTFF